MFKALTNNLFFLFSTILAFCAWVIALGGAASMSRVMPSLTWWIIVYEILYLVAMVLLILLGEIHNYRLALLVFLGVSISLLTEELQIATMLNFRGAGAYTAGYVILIVIQFIWVIVLGSEQGSFVNDRLYFQDGYRQTPPSNASVTQNHPPMAGVQSQTNVPNNDSIIKSTANSPTAQKHSVTSPAPTLDPVSPHSPNGTVCENCERTVALHTYQANPDDESELSFEKGEEIHVVDKGGNWWKAHKVGDPKVGIVPSNYFPETSNNQSWQRTNTYEGAVPLGGA